jgi:hypothetical protein
MSGRERLPLTGEKKAALILLAFSVSVNTKIIGTLRASPFLA